MEFWLCHVDNRYAISFQKKRYNCMLMVAGLTATDAVLIVLVAALCNAVPTVLTGAIGSNLYISFSHRIAREFRVLVQLFRGCQSGRLGDVLVRGTNSKWRYMCCCSKLHVHHCSQCFSLTRNHRSSIRYGPTSVQWRITFLNQLVSLLLG